MPSDTNLPGAEVGIDEENNIRHIRHVTPFEPTDLVPAPATLPQDPESFARQYVGYVAQAYKLTPSMLSSLGQPLSASDPTGEGEKLRSKPPKSMLGTSTFSFVQTYFGLPIWQAEISVVIKESPLRVLRSRSSIHINPRVHQPANQKPQLKPGAITDETLAEVLGLNSGSIPPKLINARWLVYLYDKAKRDAQVDDHTDDTPQGQPTLPLPKVSDVSQDIVDGTHYVVTDAVFTYAVPQWGSLTWRAFVDVESGAVLFLKAYTASCTGKVYELDPCTRKGRLTITAASSNRTLNPFRADVSLKGLVSSPVQHLEGDLVAVRELTDPPSTLPSSTGSPASACKFDFDVRTQEFAAVSGYYHLDFMFRTVEEMGFPLADYFKDVGFPIPVDPCTDKDQTVGRVIGIDSSGDSILSLGEFHFALAHRGPPGLVGNASDVRRVWHEFCHALLYAQVGDPNLGFAHSAGDSLAAIMCDPETKLADLKRFLTLPWSDLLRDRRHDRPVKAGWAWGGVHGKLPSDEDYEAEQVLSTTLFRIYRSIGGDSRTLSVRKFAARYMTFLIISAISTLTGAEDAEDFANALMGVDTSTENFEGQVGGVFHKVIRWGFEKQGLYQDPPLAKGDPPVTSEGDPPSVDVYIDDGRDGEYDSKVKISAADVDIRNRRKRDGHKTFKHESPRSGVTNFAYVRVKNRGHQPANNVVVSGYQCQPGGDLDWPGGWTPMTTPTIPPPGGARCHIAGGGEDIFGPFEWTPNVIGSWNLLMSVSATDDLSNIDPASKLPAALATVAQPVGNLLLVLCDNNIAQRTMQVTT
jgi:zinc metalloprotease ZmpB